MLTKIDRVYHDGSGGFREQLFSLYLDGTFTDNDKTYLKFIRNRISIGTAGSASLDMNNPGSDSHESWQLMDRSIEEFGVCGFLHTHPSGIFNFSSQDWKLIYGFALANGSKPIWHGVQTLNSSIINLICAQYYKDRFFIRIYDPIESNIDDSVFLVNAVHKISQHGFNGEIIQPIETQN